MQTMAPPEEVQKERFARIDEQFGRIDERFDEVNRRIAAGREEANRHFDDLTTETRAMRQEMAALHATIQRGNHTLLVAMLGLIATIFAKGG